MANHLRKERTSSTAGEILLDAKRFGYIRELALMTQEDQEKILHALADPVIIIGEAFDKWADELGLMLKRFKKKSKTAKPIPDEV